MVHGSGTLNAEPCSTSGRCRQREKNKTIPLSPIVGIASVAGGIALVVAGSRSRV